MYKIVANKVSTDPTKFFDETLTRTMRGKMKLRVLFAKSRTRSNVVTLQILKEFNLLYGKFVDLDGLSDEASRKFVKG